MPINLYKCYCVNLLHYLDRKKKKKKKKQSLTKYVGQAFKAPNEFVHATGDARLWKSQGTECIAIRLFLTRAFFPFPSS